MHSSFLRIFCGLSVVVLAASGKPRRTKVVTTRISTTTLTSTTTSTTSRNIHSFYNALSHSDLEGVVDAFAPNGAMYYPGVATAKGRGALRVLFSAMFESGDCQSHAQMVDAQFALPESENFEDRSAQAFIYTRYANIEGKCRKVRESIFTEEGKIRAMLTTRANDDDPAEPDFVYPFIMSSEPNKQAKKEKKQDENVVKGIVDSFFQAWSYNDGRQMTLPFPLSKKDKKGNSFFFMFDFHPLWDGDRGWQKPPYGCRASRDCETAPYVVNKSEGLRSLFDELSQGYINIEKTIDDVQVWGDLALVTYHSNACLGNELTPAGARPMRTRGMVVLHKNDLTKNKWKIHTFAWTDDPASNIADPIDACKAEPDCIEGAQVGTCYLGGMMGCSTATKGNASCVGSACTCMEGFCSKDRNICIPVPVTETTTTTTPFCDENAVVGHCLMVGCFNGHGKAHCEGDQCLCDRGSCSVDGESCVSTPTFLQEYSNRPVTEPVAEFSYPSSYGVTMGSVIALAVSCAAVVAKATVPLFRDRRRVIEEPLLQ